jgi:hypothetical protein
MKVNTLRKAMMAIGGITALVFIISLAAPKTTHAVIATFVQVVNAPSQPVPVANGTDANGVLPLQNRDIDNGPRNAIQLGGRVDVSPGAVSYFSSLTFGGATFQVPSGKRLVIEHASGTIYTVAGDSVVQVGLDAPQNFLYSTVGHTRYFVPISVGTDSAGRNRFAFSQSIRAYFDAGSAVAMSFERTNRGAADAFAFVTLDGYLVDCTGACPPSQ